MKKNKNKTILIILAIIIAILVIISIFLYAKLEAVDDRDDHSGYTTNQNNNVNNDNSSINNDNNNINENNNSNSNYISKDEALEKALNSLNISQSNIYDLSNELDYKYGQTVYEIEFKYDGYEYEFYIDAETGNIVKSFKERD